MTQKKQTQKTQFIPVPPQKRNERFRVLVCIDGSEKSFAGIKEAARICNHDDCDIILLFVRKIDQGLRTGGLQVRIARQNMLDWGIELPGIQYLKHALSILKENGIKVPKNSSNASHTDVWGDPLGDNKIEYKTKTGQLIVLKLKTAPDIATGILDQCELGPYNLIIIGPAKAWRGKWSSLWGAGVSQRVATLAHSSVLMARDKQNNISSHLIYSDGMAKSFKYVSQAAVLATHCRYSISLISVVKNHSKINAMKKKLAQTSDKLKNLGIEVKSTIVEAGSYSEIIVKESENFDVISIPYHESATKFLNFNENLSLKVMGKSEASVICVR